LERLPAPAVPQNKPSLATFARFARRGLSVLVSFQITSTSGRSTAV
jgi:hypothetical protein